jgi:hypothetical protein
MIISQTVKQALNLDTGKSIILSVCVSALATIGLNSHLGGATGAILLPYAALAICIILMILLLFLIKIASRAKEMFGGKSVKENYYITDEKNTDDRSSR